MIVAKGLGQGGNGLIVAYGLGRDSLVQQVARFLTVTLEIRN